MKRPISLTIVGTVWFLIGVLGAVNDAIQTHGFEIPGANFINLLVGVGLLNGWRMCRWYALFVTGFAFVFLMLFASWAFCNISELVYRFPLGLLRDQRPHELVSAIVVVLFIATGLLFSGWTFLVLKREEVREYFIRRSAVTV
jgi:hypothetical protein